VGVCLVRVQGAEAWRVLGQDLSVDQAFQLGADAFGVFGLGADAQRLADVLRAQGIAVTGVNTARICWCRTR
jgi:hypothetical protein